MTGPYRTPGSLPDTAVVPPSRAPVPALLFAKDRCYRPECSSPVVRRLLVDSLEDAGLARKAGRAPRTVSQSVLRLCARHDAQVRNAVDLSPEDVSRLRDDPGEYRLHLDAARALGYLKIREGHVAYPCVTEDWATLCALTNASPVTLLTMPAGPRIEWVSYGDELIRRESSASEIKKLGEVVMGLYTAVTARHPHVHPSAARNGRQLLNLDPRADCDAVAASVADMERDLRNPDMVNVLMVNVS